ncbi:hypothetical protein Acr_16g0005380 [Actinidia rufa]|uniref:Uncharacterized protein n=1 Tax=Actinidia rufa TaxID=165716 RepID=A0A7J0FZB9_9ERIC|nr:hypothetical protein Acr_16g0005380 [Actinidia rufa]
MEAKTVKQRPLLIAAVVFLWLFSLAPDHVESVIGIQMGPCTPQKCVEACKKIVKEKYQSANCVKLPWPPQRSLYCFASSRLVWVAKASTMTLSMEVKAGKKCALVVVTMAVWFLVPYPQSGECAFGIQINPCTLSHCVAECKKDLQEKYHSATCALGSQGKFCICLG